MFLSIFKERTLNDRLERFFSRLNNGKLKGGSNEKNVWVFDAIELKMEETKREVRCYFNVDHRTIYIFHYMKEVGESKMIVEREDYLHENGCPSEALKANLLSCIQRNMAKNPC